MPLQTQIIREGTLLSLRWGWWHVMCMDKAAELEGHDLSKSGKYTLLEAHTFTDPDDGEVLELLAGDELRMWR